MLKLLETYLDINQIENPEKYLAVGELMIQNPSRSIIFLNQKKYILSGFHDLLNQKITPEVFFQLGDIGSEQSIDHTNYGLGQIPFILHQFSSNSIGSDTIVVIDEIAHSYILSHQKTSPKIRNLLSQITLHTV